MLASFTGTNFRLAKTNETNFWNAEFNKKKIMATEGYLKNNEVKFS